MATPCEKPAYVLQEMHFSGLASMAVPLWYGGDDSFEIQTDPRHRLDFEVVDAHDGVNYIFEGRAYNDKKDYDPMAEIVQCTQVEGLQLLATIYDEYALDCRVNGRAMKKQDAATLSAMQTLNARHKQQSLQPYVLVTQKLILPDLGLTHRQQRNLGLVTEATEDYYGSYARDYQAMYKYWDGDTDRRLHEYGEKFSEPVQFVATLGEARAGYQLVVIEPFGYTELDYMEDLSEICTALKALEAGFILPAPRQPEIIQHWAQNVHVWDRQEEGLRAVRPSDIGDAIKMLNLDRKRTVRNGDSGATDKISTQPIFPN